MSTPITKRYIKRYQGYANASPEYQTYMDLIELLDEFVRDHQSVIHLEFPVVEEIRLILTRMPLKRMRNHEYRVISESFGRESNPYVSEIVRVFGTFDIQNGKSALTRIFKEMVRYANTRDTGMRKWYLKRERNYQRGPEGIEENKKEDKRNAILATGVVGVAAIIGAFLVHDEFQY